VQPEPAGCIRLNRSRTSPAYSTAAIRLARLQGTAEENKATVQGSIGFYGTYSVDLTSMCSAPAVAHDQWADGSPIPAWVSKYYCGAADAHRLTIKQIYRVEGGWRADGYAHTIPEDRVLPSEDGDVWLFFRSYKDSYQSTPFCFFVPQGST
jgi:hypothetical protein